MISRIWPIARLRAASVACLLVLLQALTFAGIAEAHDPSPYGGVFRSRNMGEAWLNADIGLFLNVTLALAVDPRDPEHLLLGTDVGLWRSQNGGRSWMREAEGLIVGAVFAIAFASDGQSVMCAAQNGVFRFVAGGWTQARAPEGAIPARGIAAGASPSRVYLLGRSRLFVSDDGGQTYAATPTELSDQADITALAIATEPREVLLAVVDGEMATSEDGGRHWRRHAVASSTGPVDTVNLDPDSPTRAWAAAADRIYRSDDLGLTWQAFGGPLPEPQTTVRGIAANEDATAIVLTTHRGMYRSEDSGQTWALKEGNLPIHLESGPITRDPSDARVLYAVYSLLPYSEVWRTAIEGGNLLAHLDPVSIAGGAAFVLLLLGGGMFLALRLARLRGDGPRIRHARP
ncbi:MAG: hypothetical protein JO288_03115 [Hyphomicrobiales bacterium]|nr:hypothetical protein [Hyphomicrobiales bacterium]